MHTKKLKLNTKIWLAKSKTVFNVNFGTFCHQKVFLTQQKVVDFLNSVDLLQGEKLHTQMADLQFFDAKADL
jgi:hypothetical protein